MDDDDEEEEAEEEEDVHRLKSPKVAKVVSSCVLLGVTALPFVWGGVVLEIAMVTLSSREREDRQG